MAADNNSKGIILIMIAMTLFAMQDSLIKFIFEQSALYEIFFGRYLVAAILLFCNGASLCYYRLTFCLILVFIILCTEIYIFCIFVN